MGNAAQYNDLRLGSAGLYRLAFGRPSLCGTLDQLRQQRLRQDGGLFQSRLSCALRVTWRVVIPNNRGFGNLGRNVLRGHEASSVSTSGLPRTPTSLSAIGMEFRWDVFNVFNNVNFATRNNVIGEAGTDFGKITDTVGGPRVMQFGLKLKF